MGLLQYTPDAAEMADLRRRQAAFDRARREESRRNSWMAVPALAPAAAIAALEGGAILAAGAVRAAPRALARAASLPKAVPRPLSQAEKQIIRAEARRRYAAAAGTPASSWGAQVHHRIALEFQHLMARADPNRLANLLALRQQAHSVATNSWAAFARGLNGRTPTQAELVAQAMKVDKLVEPFILRARVARPGPTPPRPLPKK